MLRFFVWFNKSALLPKMAHKFNFFKIVTSILSSIGLWHSCCSNLKRVIRKTILIISVLLTVVLILLEHVYGFVSYNTNKTEFIKTIGTVAYHLVALSRICLFYTRISQIEVVLKHLERKSIHLENFYILNKASHETEKSTQIHDLRTRSDELMEKANLLSLIFYGLMMLTGMQSLTFSYSNALLFPQTEFDPIKNQTVTIKSMPYNHYTLLNISKTHNFYIETCLQSYIITYMTVAFLSKYIIPTTFKRYKI